jgi:hypothetical protein
MRRMVSFRPRRYSLTGGDTACSRMSDGSRSRKLCTRPKHTQQLVVQQVVVELLNGGNTLNRT